MANISDRNILFFPPSLERFSGVVKGVTRPCLQCLFGFGMVLVMARLLEFDWCSSSHDSTKQNDEDRFLKDGGFRLEARRWRRTSSAACLLPVSTHTFSLKTRKEI